MVRVGIALCSICFLSSCASPPMIPAAALADLAPTGKVRVGIMYTNPVTALKDPATGQLIGIAVDLARELGRRTTLPVELVGYETAAYMMDGLKSGAWDVAFTGYDPEQTGISFAPSYLDTEGTFLVQ